MKNKSAVLCLCFCFFCMNFGSAQETEAFGFDEDSGAGSAFNITIGGRLSFGGAVFFNDLKTLHDTPASSLISGKLHIHAAAPMTEAYFGVKLSDKTIGTQLGCRQPVFPADPQIPRWLDEMFLKVMLGPAVLSGGIQKITWGRAEQLSVLDIINPRDKTDMTISDCQDIKIARPLAAAAFYLPYDIKFEALFLPVFEGHHIPAEKTARWYSRQFDGIMRLDDRFFAKPYRADTLEYAQGGGRLSVSAGGMHDVGVQYFYGRLPDIAFKTRMPAGAGQAPQVYALYNPYHHIGFDYGLGIGPIALVAECAANITADLSGDLPWVYNPFFAWNAGITYSAPRGVRLNITAAETIRLHHKRIGTALYDVEQGRKVTDTKLDFSLSQAVLRNSFEWKVSTIIGLEDADFCIMPGINWQFATLLINCTAGIFGGLKTGMYGQFYRNSFLRLTLAYEF